MMRLDKLLSLCGMASRSDSGRAIRRGEVLVNGVPARNGSQSVNEQTDVVVFRGETVVYRPFVYVLLNKPEGYVSATEDARERTVLELLPDEVRRIRPELFPCGRLDKNTLGLMLLTNNGELSHRLLSPKRHVDKTYRYRVKFPLSDEDIAALEAGVDIGGYTTAPCRVTREGNAPDREGLITLHEGKYHQIKLMMEARHNQITYLERVTFGPLALPADMERGTWRYLTDEEIGALHRAAGLDTK